MYNNVSPVVVSVPRILLFQSISYVSTVPTYSVLYFYHVGTLHTIYISTYLLFSLFCNLLLFHELFVILLLYLMIILFLSFGCKRECGYRFDPFLIIKLIFTLIKFMETYIFL